MLPFMPPHFIYYSFFWWS